MTETEKKALALLNEICVEMGLDKVRSLELDMPGEKALLRAIEAHEAFKIEVSDAVEDTKFMVETHCDTEALALVSNRLNRFIIAKPDPLEDAIAEVDCGPGWKDGQDYAKQVRAAMKARGYEFTKINKE